jgi:hypothetical protein
LDELDVAFAAIVVAGVRASPDVLRGGRADHRDARQI